MNQPTAIDLFCGAGGLSLGLTWAGFRVACAVDNDDAAISTYRKNLGDHALNASIVDCTPEELLECARLKPGECTLLAGGPPCQGFSVKRNGPREDARNELVFEFIRFVALIRPEFFLIENVAGLMSKHGRPYLDHIIQTVSESGYVCHLSKLEAADYGVPQSRARVFLIGERLTARRSAYQFPQPTLPRSEWVTVRTAIGDLPPAPIDGTPHPTVPNHFGEARLSKLNLERIRHVPEGGGRQHLPPHLELSCHKKDRTLRHVDTYGRLSWDQPSVTITARFDSFTRGRFGHPCEDRSLTLREGARLQTFPDDFIFYGSREECARQIGNAVPPVLARTLGESILAAIVRSNSELATAASPIQTALF